jgi:hypothetical protein
MSDSIAYIYGEQVLDDLAYCRKHEKIIERYSHGIMTLMGSPLHTLKSVASDPASIPGWKDSFENHPKDIAVLQEFFSRLVKHYATLRTRKVIFQSVRVYPNSLLSKLAFERRRDSATVCVEKT